MTEKDTAENFDTNAEADNEQRIADQQEAAGKTGHINGHKQSAAAAIMGDPAAAAHAAALPTPEVLIQRTLGALPGLVGAIDHAIKDQTGKHQPFVLLIFAEGTALHSANFNPKVAQKAVIELAQRWDTGDEAVVVNGNTPAGDIPRAAGPAEPGAAVNDSGEPHVTH